MREKINLNWQNVTIFFSVIDNFEVLYLSPIWVFKLGLNKGFVVSLLFSQVFDERDRGLIEASEAIKIGLLALDYLGFFNK